MTLRTKTITVTMFGNFTIAYHDIVLTNKEMKSNKLMKLLSYVMLNHDKIILSNELSDYLWENDEIDNPANALKNLVYRLRILLRKFFDINDLIVTGRGAYSLNQEYEIIVDAIHFEFLNEQIIQKKGYHLLEDYKEMLSLYNGKYMNEIKDDYNILIKSTFYHSLYISRVIEYSNLLEGEEEYVEMEKILRKTLEIDHLEETIYEALITSLFLQRRYQQALETYQSTAQLLYQTLGIQPSQSMQALYQLIHQEIYGEEAPHKQIDDELNYDTEINGAYLCDYTTFKEIYKVQARILNRLQVPAYYCLIHIKGQTIRERNDDTVINDASIKVEQALQLGLRRVDILSKITQNQWIVMLMNCDHRNAILVMNRVLRKLRYSLHRFGITLEVEAHKVEPK